jgi:5'(3')-deoxyribonucleotidase
MSGYLIHHSNPNFQIVISTLPTELGEIDPSTIIADKIGWIIDNIGARWQQYIVCQDKGLLKGHFLIDPHPRPSIQ